MFTLFEFHCRNRSGFVFLLCHLNQRRIIRSLDIANTFTDHLSAQVIVDSARLIIHFPNTSSLFLVSITVSTQQMSSYLPKLFSTKSIGPNGIPSITLKHGGPDLSLLLFRRFNLFITNGHFPVNLKYSIYYLFTNVDLTNSSTILDQSITPRKRLKYLSILCSTPSTTTSLLKTVSFSNSSWLSKEAALLIMSFIFN